MKLAPIRSCSDRHLTAKLVASFNLGLIEVA